MNEAVLERVVAELRERLIGRVFGRMLQLSKQSLIIEFREIDSSLLIDIATSDPRMYLTKHQTKRLDKQVSTLSPFAMLLRKQLGSGVITDIKKASNDRIVDFSFEVSDVLGFAQPRELIVQLTGRSANIILLDGEGLVIDSMRSGKAELIPGTQYVLPQKPPPAAQAVAEKADAVVPNRSISEQLEAHYAELASKREFADLASRLIQKQTSEIAKKRKLLVNLDRDLAGHGDAAEHKRAGEILLSNIGTAVRRDDKVFVTDYFQEAAPIVEFEIDRNTTIQDEANRRFARYTKAKRAAEEIVERRQKLVLEIHALERRLSDLEAVIEEGDPDELRGFEGAVHKPKSKPDSERQSQQISGVRSYISSDGFDVLVGRNAGDNDRLTFRIAGPHDLWLHAADYPGSHVVVRNPKRIDIPQKTMLEAAQIAAYFSQAKADSRVNVHYSERKFLSKPKGSAPGLVRMSRVKTVLVEPRESMPRRG